MKKLLPLLVWRYIRGARDEHSIATMIQLCFLSMLIGSGSLALVMAIMNGFEKATYEKMQGIHAHITMRIPEQAGEYEKISSILTKQFPEISSYSPEDNRQVVIQNPALKEFETVLLKAIDPEKEAHTSTLESKIVTVQEQKSGTTDPSNCPKTLAYALADNQILLGEKLAQRLHVVPGATVNLLFAQERRIRGAHVSLSGSPVIIGGTFSAGIEEFDAGMILCSFALLKKLFPDAQPTQVSLKLAPEASEEKTLETLHAQFPSYEIFSWKELYPALVAALILEKYAMFFILSLIMLVACMNVVSLLFMQITQKQGDIAIMKAMGMPDAHITRLFVWLGMGISISATTLGLVLASIASWFLEHYPFITLPDVYFVSHLPARMEWGLLLQVFIVIMIISFITCWFPAQKTRRINIADVLRFEA
jgi:lipoprotein-releasing system permease protein